MFHDMFIGNFGLGWLLWIIIIVLAVALIWRNTREKDKYIPFENKETVLDILKKRYAKGEIAKEEFDRMKKEIE